MFFFNNNITIIKKINIQKLIFINFTRQIKADINICLIYIKFNLFLYGSKLLLLGGRGQYFT